MSILRLAPVDENAPTCFSCGVKSIDKMVSDAYEKTLYKQAAAYNIYCDGIFVGSCMVRITTIHEEDGDCFVGTPIFAAYEICYIAIDKRYQRKKIGSYVLKSILATIKELSKNQPIRFIVIEAFPELQSWYTSFNFKPFNMLRRKSYEETIPMRIDLISKEEAKRIEEYCKQQW